MRPTGSLKVVRYEIDGVGGAITPMVSETANIHQRSRTVFVCVDSKDDIVIFGVWRVTKVATEATAASAPSLGLVQ